MVELFVGFLFTRRILSRKADNGGGSSFVARDFSTDLLMRHLSMTPLKSEGTAAGERTRRSGATLAALVDYRVFYLSCKLAMSALAHSFASLLQYASL